MFGTPRVHLFGAARKAKTRDARANTHHTKSHIIHSKTIKLSTRLISYATLTAAAQGDASSSTRRRGRQARRHKGFNVRVCHGHPQQLQLRSNARNVYSARLHQIEWRTKAAYTSSNHFLPAQKVAVIFDAPLCVDYVVYAGHKRKLYSLCNRFQAL
jgi:hypothetical protein